VEESDWLVVLAAMPFSTVNKDGFQSMLPYYPRFLWQGYYLNFYSFVKRNNCG
jgi:hypothetical protein